jgi:hypothetical protein
LRCCPAYFYAGRVTFCLKPLMHANNVALTYNSILYDDITVAGSNASPRSSPASDRSPKEMVLKLEFFSNSPRHPVALAGPANKTFRGMYSSFFKELNNLNNQGKKVSRFDGSVESFLKQFNLQTKFYAKKASKHRYFFVFRIETKIKFGEIRKDSGSKPLHDHSARLIFSPWTEEVNDVINLGWFWGPLPKYTISEEMNTRVVNFLAFHASVGVKNSKISLSDGFSLQLQGRHIACRAYSLTVQRKTLGGSSEGYFGNGKQQ